MTGQRMVIRWLVAVVLLAGTPRLAAAQATPPPEIPPPFVAAAVGGMIGPFPFAGVRLIWRPDAAVGLDTDVAVFPLNGLWRAVARVRLLGSSATPARLHFTAGLAGPFARLTGEDPFSPAAAGGFSVEFREGRRRYGVDVTLLSFLDPPPTGSIVMLSFFIG